MEDLEARAHTIAKKFGPKVTGEMIRFVVLEPNTYPTEAVETDPQVAAELVRCFGLSRADVGLEAAAEGKKK